MIRLKLVLIGVGIALGFIGYQEYTVSQKASFPAAKVELQSIEDSAELSNNFIRIGSHWAVYPGSIYEYEMDKYETGEPDDKTKVNFTYYPIVSESHPYVIQLSELFDRYGDEASIPENEWPEFEQFSVLVKSKRFKTIGSIPLEWMDESSLEGLVINKIKTLTTEEASLLRESFPQIDLNKVLIVEDGRKPSSQAKSIGMLGGGSFLCLLGLFLLFKRRTASY